MRKLAATILLIASCTSLAAEPTPAEAPADATAASPPAYDAALAAQLGADQRGMRSYVLVILKSGPHRMPDGDDRKAMFAGHFANMARLAEQGKLVLAGPFSDDPQQWRGLFVFAVADIDEAKALTATDPVIIHGEMVAEYHRWYGSAAVMKVPAIHATLSPPAAAVE
jgi:uncharacterized protein YciI